MVYQRIDKSSSWNSSSQEKSSQFAPRPFAVQAQQDSHRSPTQEEIENEAFNQNKFEAFGLQRKEKHGTITPVEQERLGVLQAKMDDFWVQRRAKVSQFSYSLESILGPVPENPVSNNVQLKLAKSDQLNQSIQARAFTTGQDVFFRQGEYQPGSRSGQELIAHELTHVVQQNGEAVKRSPLPPQQLPQHPATETPSASARDLPLQAKGDKTGNRPDSSVEQRPNKTGMPDALKAGVESLSGYSLDDVKVHYNSPKPAQLQALAYTQGTEIHVASGQEEHLPHEAWHVVQQMQGRVKPTMQMKGVQINDDEGLEKEADVMGAKAMDLSNQTDSTQVLQEASLTQQSIQRRVGFEFQTNLLLRDEKNSAPKLKTPLFESEGWHIECDQGDLEFVTEPQSTYSALVKVMNMIVTWAHELSSVKETLPEDVYNQYSFLLESKFEDERQMGIEAVEDKEHRPLSAMKVNQGTRLEQLFAVGPARKITAAPQTTIGVPLDKIISSLHLIASQKITLSEGTDKQKTVGLGSAQQERPVLIPAHDETVRLVNLLRINNPEIKEADWRKLEGIIGLAASYIKSANQDLGKPIYAYIKMMAPLMSRVNFSAMYNAIPESVQSFFNSKIVAEVAGLKPENQVFGPKGAMKDVPGPSITEWVESIRKGFDALSTLGINKGLGTEQFIKDSESMGEFNVLDTDDEIHKLPLVPIELRQISKGVPVDQWPELALEIMIFSNALIKSKFY